MMMSKLTSVFLAISMMGGGVPETVPTASVMIADSAGDTQSEWGEHLNWSLDAATDTLTISGTGDMYDDLSSRSFNYNPSAVRKVVIKDGVTSIGNSAFSVFDQLEEVLIPDSVTSIGDYAFDSCQNLKTVRLPKNLTSIGDGSFGFCDQLTDVTIPDSVTNIGNYAFQYCGKMTEITIPGSVKSVGESAFYSSGLENVTIQDGVEKIGEQAFSSCESLTSLIVPDTVTEMGNYALAGCSAMTAVKLSDGLTELPEWLFNECGALRSLTLPSGVTEFQLIGLDSLKELTVPNPDCVFPDYVNLLPSLEVINSIPGSEVEFFATRRQIPFHSLDDPSYVSSGIMLETRTQANIVAYMQSHPVDLQAAPSYETAPATTAPYAPGKLDANTQKNALNMLNIVRFVAGIGEVSSLDDYAALAQASALVNSVNGELTHMPAQPKDMSDALFQTALQGSVQSNIGMGYSDPACSVLYGYMHDSDPFNIQSVGHRRWCLNPAMNATGFGYVDNFTAMYAVDQNNSARMAGVAWPAQQMPVELFSSGAAWSFSTGFEVNAGAIHVTLSRERDHKVWNFDSASADGSFYVDNLICGTPGCIIFRPDDVGDYQAGDTFRVEITGLATYPDYTVQFFRSGFPDDLAQEASSLPGDVNLDGAVNATDAAEILIAAAKSGAGEDSGLNAQQKLNADVNADSEINAGDAATVLMYAAAVGAGEEETKIEEFV